MIHSKIILLAIKSEKCDALVSLFETNNTDIQVVSNIPEADELISSSEPTLILIDYGSIVTAERGTLIDFFKSARRTKFVIYDVPGDATRQLAFYRLGAYRILNGLYEKEDIFYFCQNLLANGKHLPEQKETRFTGRLQDFNLPGLINNFGKEKRSGVLRIRTTVRYGKIYFNDGHIYHASAGYLKDIQAVFYMLTWTSGQFSMSPIPKREVKNRLELSNIGLLLYSEQVREEYNRLIGELGGFSKEIRIANKGDLVQQEKDPDFKNFIDKLDDFRLIYDIIENSPFKMIETLKHLIALNKSGNLNFRETGDELKQELSEQKLKSIGLAERLLTSSEVAELRDKLKAGELNTGKLLILGSKSSGKTEFIRQFNQGSLSSVRSNQELDFTSIELAEKFTLQVFGVTPSEKLSEFI
ncbi:MAG: DUF4388 domain-containing protein, partial [Calditrichales bacterium]